MLGDEMETLLCSLEGDFVGTSADLQQRRDVDIDEWVEAIGESRSDGCHELQSSTRESCSFG